MRCEGRALAFCSLLMTFSIGFRFAQRCAANLCPSARPELARARAREREGDHPLCRHEATKNGDTRPEARVLLPAREAEPLSISKKQKRLQGGRASART